MTVAGLQIRFGLTTARRLVCPADWRDRALANACPTGPSLLPMSKSMWETLARSPPSMTRASPMYMDTMRTPIERCRVNPCEFDGGHDTNRETGGQTISGPRRGPELARLVSHG